MTIQVNEGLSIEFIREWFIYDAETGEFNWRDPCKSPKPGQLKIRKNSFYREYKSRKSYTVNRLIWTWMTGNDPGAGFVRKKDSTKGLEWNNLEFRPCKTYQTKQERLSATSKRATLKHRYRLSEAEWLNLHEKQESRCAICQKSGVVLCVDHCHWTGQVRGLLCHKCNLGLGAFQDDPKVLIQCVKYLVDNGAIDYRLFITDEDAVVPIDLTLPLDEEGNQIPLEVK